MDEQKQTVVTILNRIYPPGSGITGESASELVEYLVARGFTVNVVHVNVKYKGGADKRSQPGNVFKIETFYNGDNRFLRLLSSLYEGFRMVWKARRLKSDLTICMTDPPLINMWAAMLFRRKHPWILWAMDLYPEAFVADKLVSTRNAAYKLINYFIVKYPPSHIISLGPYQTEYLLRKYNTNINYTELPCGVYDKGKISQHAEVPEWACEKDKIYLGYVGNLGKAHSLEFLKAIIEQIDVSKHRIILSLYGANAKELIPYVTDREGVILVNHVTREQLQYIDIHLSTLMEEWVNICVPSKTVSSVCSGSTFLYHGIATSDNWKLLNAGGWLINDKNPFNEVKSFFDVLNREMVEKKKEHARRLSTQLYINQEMSFSRIHNCIRALTSAAIQNLPQQQAQAEISNYQ